MACDVVFIDGDKYPDPRLTDIHNMRTMAHAGSLVFFDEATTFACVSGAVPEEKCGRHWDGAPKAFNRASREGTVRVRACSKNPKPLKGHWNDFGGLTDNVCEAEYTFVQARR